MLYERIPIKEYELIANDFNPVEFDAEKWVKTAKAAGMKYIVFTAKHHDGFAMYDSQCSDYNIVKRTPFRRDPIKELAEACRKEGIALGIYYSLGRDWHDPDVPTNWPVKGGRSNLWDYPDEDKKDLAAYLERKAKPQIKELLTNYGDIAMFWFDTYELVNKKQSKEIQDLILSIQPNCLINRRIGNGYGHYAIVEQQLVGKIRLSPWEACLTMGKNWGYNKFDTTYKTPEMIVRNFVDIVSKGGNLLLNVGPTGKGNFPAQSGPIFEKLDAWMKVNGEAIYGTRPWRVFGENIVETDPVSEEKKAFHDAEFDGTPKDNTPDIRYTRKGNTVYIFARSIQHPRFILKSLSPSDGIERMTLLGSTEKVSWKHTEGGLEVSLPRLVQTDVPVYVVKVKLKDKGQPK
jgi:alpha-L-fucosidase